LREGADSPSGSAWETVPIAKAPHRTYLSTVNMNRKGRKEVGSRVGKSAQGGALEEVRRGGAPRPWTMQLSMIRKRGGRESREVFERVLKQQVAPDFRESYSALANSYIHEKGKGRLIGG